MTFDYVAAKAWADAGCSLVPLRTDGSKSPAVGWKQAQSTAADLATIEQWSRQYDGFGVVGGTVSGELEMLELEGRAVTEGFLQRLQNSLAEFGFSEVWDKLAQGYIQGSPSGGVHFVYRVDGKARGNTKLARRPATPEELTVNPDELVKVLIETRGEGGQFVAAPSAGRTHPTGKAWTALHGSPATISTLTFDDRDNLYGAASFLDEMPAQEPAPAEPPRLRPAGNPDEKRPGDDYIQRATWDEILIPEGWTKVRPMGQGYTWRRPGKNDPGISATTGQSKDGADRLYVFTSSTTFTPEKPYNKFSAYAHLHYDDDYKAASAALRKAGYGDQTPPAKTDPLAGLLAPGNRHQTDGNLALVHHIEDHRPSTAPEGELHRGQLRMAERLVTLHHENLRLAHGIGWHCWDGTKWAPDDDGAPIRAAIDTIKAAYTDLPLMAPEDRKPLFKDIGSVESSNGCSGMLKLAGAILPIATAPARLDADPELFNLPDGTLELEAGQLRAHDRDDLITRVAGAPIAADDHRAAEWDAFLARVLPDQDVRAFTQRLFGCAMLGKVVEHVMPIFTGTGANGKGTIRDAVLHAFGDYAIEVDPKLLMESKHERHSTELMELRGRRLVFCSETERGRRFAEATMKRLVGGDPIQARKMHKDPITFMPSHTLIMLTNHLPTVSGDDPAVWRRILIVPFDVVIPPEERDSALPQRLRDAAPAVMRWVYNGWLDYQRIGLAPPPIIQARTEAYRSDSDALGRFIDERCLVNPNAHTRARELYTAYVQWCNGTGERHSTETEFGKSMASRGQEKTRSAAGQIYRGIGLLAADDDVEGT